MWAIPVLNGNANKDCYCYCYCIRVFCKTTLNCLEYSQQEKCFGWILCHFLWYKLILLCRDAYVCIAYNDVPKVHWKTIYCGKFTVEGTEHSAWAMFRQHDSWIISNIIFEAHPKS